MVWQIWNRYLRCRLQPSLKSASQLPTSTEVGNDFRHLRWTVKTLFIVVPNLPPSEWNQFFCRFYLVRSCWHPLEASRRTWKAPAGQSGSHERLLPPSWSFCPTGSSVVCCNRTKNSSNPMPPRAVLLHQKNLLHRPMSSIKGRTEIKAKHSRNSSPIPCFRKSCSKAIPPLILLQKLPSPSPISYRLHVISTPFCRTTLLIPPFHRHLPSFRISIFNS